MSVAGSLIEVLPSVVLVQTTAALSKLIMVDSINVLDKTSLSIVTPAVSLVTVSPFIDHAKENARNWKSPTQRNDTASEFSKVVTDIGTSLKPAEKMCIHHRKQTTVRNRREY